MATKTTRVTAVIAAKVEGDKEITDLAKQLDKLPDQQDIEVAADVTGTKELAGLAETIDRLPETTSTRVAATVSGEQLVAGLSSDLNALPASSATRVAATVTGDEKVTGLATDVRGLPGSTATKVAASVTGGELVDGLATDIAGLPASTTTKVDTTVSGDDKIDTLVKQLAALPAQKTIDVKANISSNGKAGTGGVKDLNDEIDGTKRKTRDLGVEGAAFGSQFLGPFSEGAALFGDLSEQLRNIGDEAEGAGGKLKGLAAAGVGLGIGVAVGIAIDGLVKSYQQAQQRATELLGIQDQITQAIIDSGDAQSTAVKQAELAGIKQSDVYKTLAAQGIDYRTIVEGLTDPSKFGTLQAAIEASGRKAESFWGTLSGVDAAAASDTSKLVDAARNISNVAGKAADAAPEIKAVDDAFLGIDSSAGKLGADTFPNLAKGIALTRGEFEATAGAGNQLTETEVNQWLEDQVKAADDAADALADQGIAAAQAAVDNDGLSQALADAGDAASDAQRDLQFLGAEIDHLAGRDRTAEQAALDLGAGIDDLASAYADAVKAKQFDKKALKDWNVAALSATKGGRDLVKSVDEVRKGYDESVASAFEAGAAHGDVKKGMADARKAADAARASFITEAKNMGLTGKEAAALADKVGLLEGKKLTDKKFKVLADDKLAQRKLLVLEAKKLADKVLKVNADKSPAERTLALLHDKQLAPKIQQILGQTSDVNEKIRLLKQLGIPDKEARIIAKATGLPQAQAEIQDVADKDYQAEIRVGAKLAQDNLTAFVFRNVAGFSAVAPPPAGATTEGLSAASSADGGAAPAVTRAPTISVRSGQLAVPAAIIINVSGAIDPASTARQIKQILVRAERRTGPLRASAGNLRAPV